MSQGPHCSPCLFEEMNSRRWCRSLHIFIVLCARLANAATESEVSPTVNVSPTNGGAFSSATPAPDVTEAVDSTSVGTTGASEAPTVLTDEPSAPTVQPVVTPEGNLLPLDTP